MINEIDEALRAMVRAEVINGAEIDVEFDAPTREWASRRNTPTIDLYLYDLREDIRRRQTGYVEHRNERGILDERQDLPRFFKLAYLLTAWTQRPEDEHRLLSAILATFIQHEVVPESYLPPALVDLGMPIGLQIAYPPPEDRQVSDVWSSLGGDLKPSIDLVVYMGIRPAKLYEIAHAVMAPLRLRAVGQTTVEVEDEMRQGRQMAGPGGLGPPDGESAETDGGPAPRSRPTV